MVVLQDLGTAKGWNEESTQRRPLALQSASFMSLSLIKVSSTEHFKYFMPSEHKNIVKQGHCSCVTRNARAVVVEQSGVAELDFGLDNSRHVTEPQQTLHSAHLGRKKRHQHRDHGSCSHHIAPTT